MGFASAYLEERTIFPEFIKEPPDPETGLIVVVPSYNETGITVLLDSLAACSDPGCAAEVIIVVNAPGNTDTAILQNNRKTIVDAAEWKNSHPFSLFRLYILDVTQHAFAGWGVGMARKTGMDEAVRRFNRIGVSDGVILSLDADCTVEANYLAAVRSELRDRKEHSACSVYFEHPLSGTEYPRDHYEAIILYELHLRYYLEGLAFTGFPYVHHTVGSSMAVKAISYVKAGGMNRRKAGEDFYFIQKLVSGGGYFNLATTTVYPSPRSSLRVPFGTGATIRKMTDKGEKTLLSYNIQAFKDLKSVFSLVKDLSLRDPAHTEEIYRDLPESIRNFISLPEWRERMTEISSNTSGPSSFIKRFYNWFNMFRIVKYMNSVHGGIFEKIPVDGSAYDLLGIIGRATADRDPLGLLLHYRLLEKGN